MILCGFLFQKTLADLDLEDISPIEKQIAMLPNLEPEHSTAKVNNLKYFKCFSVLKPGKF